MSRRVSAPSAPRGCDGRPHAFPTKRGGGAGGGGGGGREVLERGGGRGPKSLCIKKGLTTFSQISFFPTMVTLVWRGGGGGRGWGLPPPLVLQCTAILILPWGGGVGPTPAVTDLEAHGCEGVDHRIPQGTGHVLAPVAVGAVALLQDIAGAEGLDVRTVVPSDVRRMVPRAPVERGLWKERTPPLRCRIYVVLAIALLSTGAFSHSAGTAPNFSLCIPGTPLQTTPLQKRA